MARVALFPIQNPVNPYVTNLVRALERQGVALQECPLPLTQQWVRERQGAVDILHFNWPSYYYAGPDLAVAVRDLLLFVRGLALAQECGYRIVWTVHNVFSHDLQQTELDHLAKVVLARLADALVVHSRCTRDRIRDFFDRNGRDVTYVPHGHYIDDYPNQVTRGAARARLGLAEDEFVYLFFGYVRPYKGVSELVDAFSKLPGPRLRLVIAGHPHPANYVAELVEHAGGDARVRLDPRLIPAEDVQLYFNAADAVVLPFNNILTSGSVILALSFGKPVVAPALGGIPELIDDEVGVLYDPFRLGALTEALARVRHGFDLASAGRRAFTRARQLDWDTVGRQIAAVYTSVLDRSNRGG